MKVLEMEGRTVDDATKKALNKLGIIDSSQVNIEVLEQGKSGIFGFGCPDRPRSESITMRTARISAISQGGFIGIMQRMGDQGGVKDIKEGIEGLHRDRSESSSRLNIDAG
jgi:predicted RNA-binding protein Jag